MAWSDGKSTSWTAGGGRDELAALLSGRDKDTVQLQ